MRNIFLFCFISILWGCHTNKPENIASEVIKINPLEAEEFVNLSDIADSVKCIKLQVDSADVMGRVREIVIREKYIYAMDISQQAIFVFNKEGQFIAKLDKLGEGPEEYTWMGPVFIDEDENYVDIIDRRGTSTKLKRYSNIDFRLLDEFFFPMLKCNSCKRNDSYYYFATQQLENVINNVKTNAGLIVVDDKVQLKSLFDKNIVTNNSSFCPYIESFTQNDKGELFVSMMYDNTCYKIEKDSVIPVYTLDFGRYGMNNSIGEKSLEEQMEYIKKKSKLAFFPVLNMDNKNMTIFNYFFKGESERLFRESDFRQYIRLKESGKVYHFARIKNDLTSFPDHLYVSSSFFDCAHEVWYKDYLVDIVLPNYYFKDSETSSALVEGVGEITAEDNPIVVLIKVKSELLK